MVWNWLAGILTFAMAAVICMSLYILLHDRHKGRRNRVLNGSPELWVFAIGGGVVIVVLWSIFAIQWLAL